MLLMYATEVLGLGERSWPRVDGLTSVSRTKGGACWIALAVPGFDRILGCLGNGAWRSCQSCERWLLMPAPCLRFLAGCAAVACPVVALVAQGARAAGSGTGVLDKAGAGLVEGRWQEAADLGEAAGTASAFVARLKHGARASKALEPYECALNSVEGT